jgi:hypothetical protein
VTLSTRVVATGTVLLGLIGLRLPAAAADQQAEQKLKAVETEVARLKDADPAKNPKAKSYAEMLTPGVALVRDMLDGKDAPQDAAAPELHLVGVYEGVFPEGPRKFGQVSVEVEATGRPIVLALCAANPVRWDLKLAQGMRLQRLIIAGHKDQLLASAPPPGVNVENYSGKDGGGKQFYAYSREGDSAESFTRAAATLRDMTGLEIAALVGEYRPKGTLVVGPSNPAWRLQRAMSHLEPLWREATALERSRQRLAFVGAKFQAIRWSPTPDARPFNAAGDIADFTVAGPIESTPRKLPAGINRIAVDPRGPTLYAIHGHAIAQVDLATGRTTAIDIKEDIPELSWPCGLAFDTKRNRVVLTSLGGIGYMYAYDPQAKSWSLLGDMGNVDLQSLAYCADDDSLYGIGTDLRRARQSLCLFRFEGTGAGGQFRPLDLPLRDERMRMHSTPLQLVSAGKHLALLVAPEAGADRQGQPRPMTCYVIDPRTAKVVYSGELHPTAAPEAAPQAGELPQLWKRLQEADAQVAARAIEAKLIAAGDAFIAFLRANLPNRDPADAAKVRDLLARLDQEQWKDREDATAQLLGLAGTIEPQLRAAQASATSEEVRSRIAAVLQKIQTLRDAGSDAAGDVAEIPDPALRARLYAIRILSRIATPAAVEALREMAAIAPGSLESEWARAALRRI